MTYNHADVHHQDSGANSDPDVYTGPRASFPCIYTYIIVVEPMGTGGWVSRSCCTHKICHSRPI